MSSTIYSSGWSINSQKYDRTGGANPFYYFEAIQVTVSTSSNYSFRSSSTIDTYAYLYYDTFDPYCTTTNLLQQNDDGGWNLQFLIQWPLLADSRYILH